MTRRSTTATEAGSGRWLEPVILNRYPADQVFLDDPLKHDRRAGMIPGRPGPDHRDRPHCADAQAADFVAKDSGVAAKSHFAEPLLEEFPRFLARRPIAALGFLGIGAQENLPARGMAAEPLQGAFSQLKF